MSETHRIAAELSREHDGEPWHGSSLTALLRGVTAPQAAAHVVPHVHTIWQLVLHLTAWKQEVRRRLSGAPAGEPQAGDWPEVGATTPERWRDALQKLDEAHDALVAAVRALPEAALDERTRDGRDPDVGGGVTNYVLLHGVAQHDAYHAGQIALLVKVVRTL